MAPQSGRGASVVSDFVTKSNLTLPKTKTKTLHFVVTNMKHTHTLTQSHKIGFTQIK